MPETSGKAQTDVPAEATTVNDGAKTFTQSELDAIVKERLDRAEAKHKKALEDFDALKAQVTELDDLKKSMATLTTERDTLAGIAKSALKYKVAFEKGLDSEALDLLDGDDEEALNTKADAILRLGGGKSSNPPKIQSKEYADRGPTSKDSFYQQLIKSAGL